MGTLLTLIRHGQSMWNASGQAQGQSIVPLSEIGHRQAGCVARSVGGDGTIQALYSSDLTRCRQTMEPIAAALGLAVCYDARLREIDVGAWQGLPFSQIRELDGER